MQAIQRHQSADGGFYHDSFPEKSPGPHAPASAYKTSFVAGLVLRALCIPEIQKECGDAYCKTLIRSITDNAGRFLLREKSDRWTWNYFSKETKEAFPQYRYPDDLDDTFICLSALHLWNKNLLDGNAWACITQALIRSEKEAGGPYHTWLTDLSENPKWKDIDVAVNANIAYFLRLSGIELPNLQKHLKQNMKLPTSPYYPSSVIPSYYLSLSIRSKNLLIIPAEESLLEHALALSVAVRAGAHKKTVEDLFAKTVILYKERSFLSEPFCIDPTQNGERHFCGSEALAAAFLLEAVSLYAHHKNKKPNTGTLLFLVTQAKKFIPENIIMASIGKRTDEIIDYPILFAEALGIPRDTGKALARANFFGWIAYYVTDNILDDPARTRHVSLAHICLRKMYFIHQKYISKERLRFCYRLLNKMDFIQYQDEVSEDKSIGQALPFIILLFIKGCPPISPQIKSMITFWRQYLSARQLSDDAHDWKDDLKNNLSNEALLIMQKHSPDPLQFDDIFWNKAFPEITREIKQRLDRAQRAIDPIERDTGTRIFSHLIEKARKEIMRATIEKEQIESFALHYTSPETSGSR